MILIYKHLNDLTEQEKKKIRGTDVCNMIEIKTSPTEFAKDLIYHAIEDIGYKINEDTDLTEREKNLIQKQVERLTKQLMKKL